ncbi:hypothetical protein [Halopseudomonas sp.]|jgi:hypothetical protein|uniref:hypothetical protein n=1 Tax=Halopseudomonas sp. TaxID=2901191 RepID=UPI0030038A96
MRVVTLKHSRQMQKFMPQVWELLRDSYAQVQGGWHYASEQELLDDSQCWRLVIHNGQVAAAVVYKAKKGLKLVAMGVDRALNEIGKRGLIRIIRADLSRCWMEVSEAAERFVMRHCNGQRYMIHGSLVADLLDKQVDPASDAYHYQREVCGLRKEKMLLGTPLLT